MQLATGTLCDYKPEMTHVDALPERNYGCILACCKLIVQVVRVLRVPFYHFFVSSIHPVCYDMNMTKMSHAIVKAKPDWPLSLLAVS